ncbi:MAG: hypothetical protein QTO32_00065 [Candidatus Organicella extenuata]|uniref:Formyl transferase N-terminal domain-containing protein n=1 Tax=Candidatus Organicella extenuata TaxID=2841811 RepID=A0AA51GGT0_9BACT|nr:MAG: hypothetical protein QTO32_00065 [Candidatus Organicella extenuata]
MVKKKLFFFTNDGISYNLLKKLRAFVDETVIITKYTRGGVSLNDLTKKTTKVVFFSTKYIANSKFLDSLDLKFYNVHPSIIPKGIGPSPLNNGILTKLKKYGMSLLKVTNKLDLGLLLNRVYIPTVNFESYKSLRGRIYRYSVVMKMFIYSNLHEGLYFKKKKYTFTKKKGAYLLLNKWCISNISLKNSFFSAKTRFKSIDHVWSIKCSYALSRALLLVKVARVFYFCNNLSCLNFKNSYGFVYKTKTKLFILKNKIYKFKRVNITFF